MSDKFDLSLLGSGELMKKGARGLVSNIGRVVAAITIIIAALVLFTDISFEGMEAESFTATLSVMLISSYVMYFSLADAGENLGKESAEYKDSLKKYGELTALVGGDMIPALRDFCKRYSKEELRYRRENLLFSCGYSYKEYESFKRGVIPPGTEPRHRRAYLRADLLRAVELTPKALLSPERMSRRSEIENPENSKRFKMFLSLIPTSICMMVTVSVMFTAKENLSFGDVIDGIVKLAALVIIGFRGYAMGYSYMKNTMPLWNDTKARLLSAFLKEEEKRASSPDTSNTKEGDEGLTEAPLTQNEKCASPQEAKEKREPKETVDEEKKEIFISLSLPS